MREVLRLPAGLPLVLLHALHRRQEPPHGDRHFGHAEGELRLADHPGVPPRRPLRGLRQCTRACPAGIDLRLLNLALARAAEANFGYRAGTIGQAEPVIGGYSEKDQESFIR